MWAAAEVHTATQFEGWAQRFQVKCSFERCAKMLKFPEVETVVDQSPGPIALVVELQAAGREITNRYPTRVI